MEEVEEAGHVAAMLLFASWFDWLRALRRRLLRLLRLLRLRRLRRLLLPEGVARRHGNDTIPPAAASALRLLWVRGGGVVLVVLVSGCAFAGARAPVGGVCVGAAVVAVAGARAGGPAGALGQGRLG